MGSVSEAFQNTVHEIGFILLLMSSFVTNNFYHFTC